MTTSRLVLSTGVLLLFSSSAIAQVATHTPEAATSPSVDHAPVTYDANAVAASGLQGDWSFNWAAAR